MVMYRQADDRIADTGERLLESETQDRLDSLYLQHVLRYKFAEGFTIGNTVLDIACGTGYGSHLLAKRAKEVVGIDHSVEVIKLAERVYRKRNLRFDIAEAPFLTQLRASQFDVIVSFETIEHILDQAQFLHTLRSRLKPSGTLIISTPNRENYRRAFYGGEAGNPYHLKELNTHEFKFALQQHFQSVILIGQLPIVDGSMSSEAMEHHEKSTEGSIQKLKDTVKSVLLKSDTLLFAYVHLRARYRRFMPRLGTDPEDCIYMVAVCK